MMMLYESFRKISHDNQISHQAAQLQLGFGLRMLSKTERCLEVLLLLLLLSCVAIQWHMDVSENGGTQQPWVFLLKMIILGCFGGTTI